MRPRLWLLLFFGFAASATLLLGWRHDHDRPLLAAHLPRAEDQASKEFDRRVKGRFPLGSSAKELEDALRADGFGEAHSYKQSRYVRLERRAGLLEESFVVIWEADGDTLMSVHGSYGLTGP